MVDFVISDSSQSLGCYPWGTTLHLKLLASTANENLWLVLGWRFALHYQGRCSFLLYHRQTDNHISIFLCVPWFLEDDWTEIYHWRVDDLSNHASVMRLSIGDNRASCFGHQRKENVLDIWHWVSHPRHSCLEYRSQSDTGYEHVEDLLSWHPTFYTKTGTSPRIWSVWIPFQGTAPESVWKLRVEHESNRIMRWMIVPSAYDHDTIQAMITKRSFQPNWNRITKENAVF
jgi:hypothetical protein